MPLCCTENEGEPENGVTSLDVNALVRDHAFWMASHALTS